MPLLLDSFKMPGMHRLRQRFPGARISDVSAEVRRQMSAVRKHIHPGMRIALAVGSRGITNLPVIVKTVAEELQSLGASPFIVSAMGSHGGGTAAGQRALLQGYGITELGVPVVTDTATQVIGSTASGLQIHFDSAALKSDMIVPVNRIKPHTDFVGALQSGLCKMLVVGLGNHRGCSSIHETEFAGFGPLLEEAAGIILSKTPVGFGVAILENAYDETLRIQVLPRERIIEGEKALLGEAIDNMPAVLIPEIDILIVEEIGKDISGAGFDPNVLGRIPREYLLPVPRIGRMVLLGITPKSHGNGVGMGLFDVITREVYESLNLHSTYTNAIASKCLDDIKIPLIADTEAEAVAIAAATLRGADMNRLRIVRIKNTLELEYIWVSDSLLDTAAGDTRLELS